MLFLKEAIAVDAVESKNLKYLHLLQRVLLWWAVGNDGFVLPGEL